MWAQFSAHMCWWSYKIHFIVDFVIVVIIQKHKKTDAL